jgi:hypothetical protein
MTPEQDNAVRAQGHNCIASMMRFNADFEYVDGAELKQIWADIETTDHLKKLRAMQRVA